MYVCVCVIFVFFLCAALSFARARANVCLYVCVRVCIGNTDFQLERVGIVHFIER